MNLNKSSSEILNQLKLSPHHAWGCFREILRSENLVNWNDVEKRNNITSNHYHLCKSEKSKW